MRAPIVYALFYLFTVDVFAGSEVTLLNRIRDEAGLPRLQLQRELTQSALRHAAYLDANREPGESGKGVSAHIELPDLPGFSGETTAERALAAGYPHRQVLENVSMGYDSARSAVDGLMSAIYHRLTFLDMTADQLGVAVGKRSRVFVLGRSDLVNLCSAPPKEALYRTPVDCLGRPMRRDAYDMLCANLPKAALFQSAHPLSCPNGNRLRADYMASICRNLPPAARFSGQGRYYEVCPDGTRLNADWFDALCAKPPDAAIYRGSGSYFQLCDNDTRVSAEWFEGWCKALPEQALYTDSWTFRRPCANEDNIRVEYLDELDTGRRNQAPDVVVWPPPEGREIPPAFYIEEPDPLPDQEVSGYPISIQFNPNDYHQVTLRDFRLFKVAGGVSERINNTRLLDQRSDPHRVLDDHEFALFPLRRLDWGSEYRVEVIANVDGAAKLYEWTFRTDGDANELLQVTEPLQRFVVQSGVEYLLYLPPSDQSGYTVMTSRTEYRRGNNVELKVVDPNTLRVKIDAQSCDPVRIRVDDGRTAELIPKGCVP